MRAIHATAVAIAGHALVVTGPSGAGKSALAAALIAAGTRARPIRLVGDDRVLIVATPEGRVVRPHPRIAGFIERRGLGLVAAPYCEAAPLSAWVELGSTAACDRVDLQDLPALALAESGDTASRRDVVLTWFTQIVGATSEAHSDGKNTRTSERNAKIRIGKKFALVYTPQPGR